MTAMDEFLQARQPELQRRLCRSRRDLERSRQKAERAAGCAEPAGPRLQSVLDLDGPLYRAVPLQLDAAILPAGRRLALSWVGTGRLIFQPQLYDAGISSPWPTASSRRPKMKRDGWWPARRVADQQDNQAADPERDADENTAAVNGQPALRLLRHGRAPAIRNSVASLAYAGPSILFSPQNRQDVDARDVCENRAGAFARA